jgi:TM2 domain-containing membrane protein YozV
VIYGIIVIAALLAAESGRHETYLDTVASAAIATALYWLAHAYAELLGRRLALQHRLSLGTLARALAHDWAIVRGATLPLLVLVIAWVTGAAQQTAVTAALWSAIASLVAFELIAGVRAHAGARELALEGCVGAAMGIAILALKIVLH